MVAGTVYLQARFALAGTSDRVGGRDAAQSAGLTGMDNWPFVLPTGLDRFGRAATGAAIGTPNDPDGNR